jgi:phosphoserine phosphatase RsbU/P
MKLLIAEDELSTRKILMKHAGTFGYEAVLAEDGEQALEELMRADGPRLALLDWMMPVRSGVDICKLIKERELDDHYYLIILTSRSEPDDIAAALDAGADDFVIKPYSAIELKARLGVGRRVLEASAQVRRLEGLLPICASCKKIRDGADYWHHVESYISAHSSANFSHSICPECVKKLYPKFSRKHDKDTEE